MLSLTLLTLPRPHIKGRLLTWLRQTLQVFEEGKKRFTSRVTFPSHSALYFNMVQNWPHPTWLIALARQWFLTMFLTAKSSTQITWFSLTILRDSLWWKSSRQRDILLWTLATCLRVLLRLLEPFCLLDSRLCLAFRLRSCFAIHLGLSNLDPSDVIASRS